MGAMGTDAAPGAIGRFEELHGHPHFMERHSSRRNPPFQPPRRSAVLWPVFLDRSVLSHYMPPSCDIALSASQVAPQASPILVCLHAIPTAKPGVVGAIGVPYEASLRID